MAHLPSGGTLDHIRTLWRKKWWLLLALLAGAVLGFVYVVVTVPTYGATAMIELVGMNESFMGMSQLDPQAGAGMYSATPANIQTQSRILMSKSLLSRVIERVNLEMTPISSTPQDVFGKVRNRIGVMPDGPLELMKEAVQESAQSTIARGVGASRLLEISCQSISPEVAATFMNALASEYISQNAQFRSNAAVKTSQWMEGQIEETKNRLEQSERKLQEFIQRSGNAFVLDQTTLDDSKLRQLQADLSASQAERITRQSRWELAKSSAPNVLPDVLDDGRLKELRSRIADLHRERAGLTTTLTPEHFKVKQVDAQIAEVEQTLQRERETLVKKIQNEYDTAVQREKMLFGAYRQQSGVLSGQAGKAAEYVTLKREAEMTRMVYNNLLQQMNQAAVIAALPTANVRLIEPAGVPKTPLSPKPLRDIPVAAGLSGLAGGAIIILLERLRSKRISATFREPGHSGLRLAVRELGVIPSAPARPSPSGFLPRARWRRLPAADEGIGPESAHEDLYCNSGDTSFLAESFRYVLASLLGGKQESHHKVILITSPGPGEGKTTLAGNLALAMASTGRRVILLDADLRRPRLHHLFNVRPSPGLHELLSPKTPVRELDLSNYMEPVQQTGLWLVPAGEITEDADGPAHLFSSRMGEFIARLRDEYEFILIDCAPALHLPDARLLGRSTDGVILVVRSGVTAQESAVSVAQKFQEDGIPVLGTVLNNWDPQGSAHSDRYDYSQYRRYYQSGKD